MTERDLREMALRVNREPAAAKAEEVKALAAAVLMLMNGRPVHEVVRGVSFPR